MATTSPVDEAGPEAARRKFGGELRALRRRAGLTGDQLADRLGWSQAKVSKTETGKTMPTVSDVRAFAEATGGDRAEVAKLVSRFEELGTQIFGWRTLLRAGIVGSQQRVADEDSITTAIRQLSMAGVPGLLQTADYARVMLTGGPDPTADVAAGVQARLLRQEVLYDPGKSFHFVMLEDVLRRRVAPPGTLAVQMDRLAQLSTLPNVRIAVIAGDRELPVPPLHGFRISDDAQVSVELETGAVQVHSPADVAYYRRMFDALAEVAEHGDAARRLLHELTRYFQELAGATPTS
ncbi:MAG: helix-turn-helix domain-containing protein [Actinomycetota bacterium]|nr:helix-turn-helix domain-containing protein [Actinomycetota bacterium]